MVSLLLRRLRLLHTAGLLRRNALPVRLLLITILRFLLRLPAPGLVRLKSNLSPSLCTVHSLFLLVVDFLSTWTIHRAISGDTLHTHASNIRLTNCLGVSSLLIVTGMVEDRRSLIKGLADQIGDGCTDLGWL